MLTRDSDARKGQPIARGVLDYFPDALAAVAEVSLEGAQKHGTFNENGDPTWDKTKSTDHADCIIRHLADRGQYDGQHRHSAKTAWRALALLQTEIEADKVTASGVDQFKQFEAQNADKIDLDATLAMMDAANGTGAAINESWDVGEAGGDKSVFVIIGDTGGPSLAEFAKALGVPLSQVVDSRTDDPRKHTVPTPKEYADKLEAMGPKGEVDRGGRFHPQAGQAQEAKSAVVDKLMADIFGAPIHRRRHVPTGVYWHASCGHFHDADGYDLGKGFHDEWEKRSYDFPRYEDRRGMRT